MVPFFVLINGIPRGHFKVGKGIRQEDPLSPYLFIMIVEVFGRNVVDLMVKGRLQGFNVASTIPPFVIQQFVDDTFLFGKSSMIEAKHLNNFLADYVSASGKCINYDKSNLFFFKTPLDLQTKILNILGCKSSILPRTYLGLPLTVKEVTPTFWNTILEII